MHTDTIGGPVETLIDRFLAEHATLTAVERFARHHDAATVETAAPAYRSLMPTTPPGPGQQYAFSVDLDSCTGCKACVTGCHSLNGLDDGETWRAVGLVVGEDFQQHVTTACHHCVDPGCMSGCPVNAYTKDPFSGIVSHLDDQCIGCRYCTLTCPYEVPQYNRDLGIVRKCDMCADRLAVGEAPACVQACPTDAISIRVVDVEDARVAAGRPWPIPAPAPSQTVPTTTYRTARAPAPAEAVDLHAVRASAAHPPLAVMLVLTQVAVGTYVVDLVARRLGAGGSAAGGLVALAVALLALGASVLHLGRPLLAYRAVLGIRHSWLSREIVAFGGFAALAGLDAAARLLGLAAPGWLGPAAALAGIAGVASSVMVYAVTGKRWWRLRATVLRFGLTTLAGGLATVAVTAAGAATRPLALLLAVTMVAKLAAEAVLLARHRRGPATSPLARTARLLTGQLAGGTRWRFGLALASGVALPVLLAAVQPGAGRARVAGVVVLLGVGAAELVERWQFFTAVSEPRMPGGVA